MNVAETIAVPRLLEAPYNSPPAADALRPAPATRRLVEKQVQALLMESPAYLQLPEDSRDKIQQDLVRIAGYAAECLREVCWQSQKIGQRPVLHKREEVSRPLVRAQADDFRPAAAGQIARVTQETLKAIAFPTFVADLIRSTFDAIINASIRQMESFQQMLSNVTKTVDQFMESNISDYQARDWLKQTYPEHITVKDGMAVVKDGAEDRKPPDFKIELKLAEDVSLDDSSIEEILVPAARRRLAENRLQLLSTLVLMGVNRIIVTGGKIRATMGFHIDTTDRAHEENASDFDFRTAAAGSFGYGPWSASASMSLSYVRSTRASSDSELNVDTDLTGEVELHFKSDYFPLNRFAPGGTIGAIRANTAVPEENVPVTASGAPMAEPIAAGGSVGKYTSPRSRRSPRPEPKLRPIGEPLPPPRMPEKPAEPEVKRRVNGEGATSEPSRTETTPPESSPPAAERSPAPESGTPASGAPAEGAPSGGAGSETPAPESGAGPAATPGGGAGPVRATPAPAAAAARRNPQ